MLEIRTYLANHRGLRVQLKEIKEKIGVQVVQDLFFHSIAILGLDMACKRRTLFVPYSYSKIRDLSTKGCFTII
jgi:hypothetical protein